MRSRLLADKSTALYITKSTGFSREQTESERRLESINLLGTTSIDEVLVV
jgi:hypothetical protein